MARKFPQLPSEYSVPDLSLVMQDVEQREALRVEQGRVQLAPVQLSVVPTQDNKPTQRPIPNQVQFSSACTQEAKCSKRPVPSRPRFQF
jgi:hypothetical protein